MKTWSSENGSINYTKLGVFMVTKFTLTLKERQCKHMLRYIRSVPMRNSGQLPTNCCNAVRLV